MQTGLQFLYGETQNIYIRWLVLPKQIKTLPEVGRQLV